MSIICVARAALRENNLYMALTSGRGDEELTSDKHFLRVLNTFTLLDPAAPVERIATGALVPYYHAAYVYALTTVGALLVLSLLVVAFSRRHV